MNKIKILWVFAVVFSLIFSSGCIKRNLSIKSDPNGATIYLNDRKIGVTPLLEYDFKWYGEHKIRLKKDGYKSVEESIYINAPIYFWMPFDLICELIPYTFWDRREFSYTLTPSKE